MRVIYELGNEVVVINYANISRINDELINKFGKLEWILGGLEQCMANGFQWRHKNINIRW